MKEIRNEFDYGGGLQPNVGLGDFQEDNNQLDTQSNNLDNSFIRNNAGGDMV